MINNPKNPHIGIDPRMTTHQTSSVPLRYISPCCFCVFKMTESTHFINSHTDVRDMLMRNSLKPSNRKEGNDTLNTFYLQLYDAGYMVKERAKTRQHYFMDYLFDCVYRIVQSMTLLHQLVSTGWIRK